MTSDGEPQEPQRPKLRGEAAWKAHKERVSASNDAARKAARAQREDREMVAAARRLAEERRIDEELIRAHEATQRN
jgi:hypothetical protein